MWGGGGSGVAFILQCNIKINLHCSILDSCWIVFCIFVQLMEKCHLKAVFHSRAGFTGWRDLGTARVVRAEWMCSCCELIGLRNVFFEFGNLTQRKGASSKERCTYSKTKMPDTYLRKNQKMSRHPPSRLAIKGEKKIQWLKMYMVFIFKTCTWAQINVQATQQSFIMMSTQKTFGLIKSSKTGLGIKSTKTNYTVPVKRAAEAEYTPVGWNICSGRHNTWKGKSLSCRLCNLIFFMTRICLNCSYTTQCAKSDGDGGRSSDKTIFRS